LTGVGGDEEIAPGDRQAKRPLITKTSEKNKISARKEHTPKTPALEIGTLPLYATRKNGMGEIRKFRVWPGRWGDPRETMGVEVKGVKYHFPVQDRVGSAKKKIIPIGGFWRSGQKSAVKKKAVSYFLVFTGTAIRSVMTGNATPVWREVIHSYLNNGIPDRRFEKGANRRYRSNKCENWLGI